jgi:hypothetical protein
MLTSPLSWSQLDGTPVRKVFDGRGSLVKSGAELNADNVYICTDGRVPYLGAPRRVSAVSPTSRRASTRVTREGRVRHIEFTRAGKNRARVQVLIRPRHVASFAVFLDELSDRFDGFPVRRVCDTSGHALWSAADLKDGQLYTCSEESASPLRTAADRANDRRQSVAAIMATELVPNKVITVFGNGMTDSAGHRVVLNKRTAPSYDRLLDLVGKLIPLQGGVRKLYTLPGCKLVRGLPLPGKTTDFIAVGTIGLYRNRLPRLAPSVDAIKGPTVLGAAGEAVEMAPAPPAPAHRPHKRPAKPKSRGKKLPPIDNAETHSRASFPGTAPLPEVLDTDPTDYVGDPGEDKALAVMAAADVAEAAKSSERERQRQKHQERYLNRQKARQQNRDNKVEQVAMAAEQVDGKIGEERARQQRALKARLDKRVGTRTQEKTLEVTGNDAARLSEDCAATVIQSAWRGRTKRPRKEVADTRKPNEEAADTRKQRKGKRKPPTTTGNSKAPPLSPNALLKVKRIPTPDLAFTKEDEEKVRALAATRIQKTFRGHQVRKKIGMRTKLDNKPQGERPSAVSVRAGGGGGDQETRDERRARRKREKESKKPRKSEHRLARPSGNEGADNKELPLPPTFEREESRFSTRGIEDKSVVELQYEIGKRIGDGNFAVVRECVRKSDGVKLALKIIDKSKTVGAKESKMIENEVKSMRSINHPHCVRLYDVVDTATEIYLVMELVPGGDLFDRIVDHGKYSEVGAATIIKNMTTALDHMHSQSIIHRDLKPENLLVSTDDNGRDTIKLADFGLAMKVKEPLHTICGTPTYVAPEIISELPEGYSFPVDMWATGIIAYIILCGFPPFASASKSQKELFRKIRSGKFSFPDPYWRNVSEGAMDLIRKLLVVDPTTRFTAKQVLSHPWIEQHTDSIEL